MNTGLVFGVFDGLHDGHRAMLEQARFRVDRLVVALPGDAVVARLKAHPPSRPWHVRADELRASGLVDEVVQGDEAEGEYHILDTVKPDVILLGYDQRELKKDLERYYALHPTPSCRTVTLEPFQPERYKSSLLNSV
jgi:FAD synthetase